MINNQFFFNDYLDYEYLHHFLLIILPQINDPAMKR